MKQKINTKTYIEGYPVAANNFLSHLLCTKNLLKQEGNNFDKTFHQDNTSAILLDTKGM